MGITGVKLWRVRVCVLVVLVGAFALGVLWSFLAGQRGRVVFPRVLGIDVWDR